MLHWIRIVVGCFFLFCFSLSAYPAEQGNTAERTVDSARFPAKVRIALDAEPVSLDPHEQLSEGGLQYSHLVFDPLVRWRQDGSVEPRLATRWQWMDATTLRVFLRHGVVFQSGNPMRAQDVVFTIHRLKNPPILKRCLP
ncbi:ABC transporter substrate-binding protein [Vibrio sp. PP-XX7]